MIDRKFTINNRFWVDITLNLVKDQENNQEHRLEPRLMSVLFMLASHVGELVTREQIISEVWNNYGGAEDSLNQTISFLRKTLQDTNKEIIETIPKKGYILHATLSSAQQHETVTNRKSKFRYSAIIAGAILAVLFVSWFLLSPKVTEQKKTTVQEGANGSVEVNFSELNKPEEEDSANTITTTAPDGTKYRLIAVGDKRPQLYVNGKLISGPEMEKYSEIEGKLLQQLWNRQSKHVDTTSSGKSK